MNTKIIISFLSILCLSHISFAEDTLNTSFTQSDILFQNHYGKGLEYALGGNFLQAQQEFKIVLSPDHLIFSVISDVQNDKVSKHTAIYIFEGYTNAWNNDWDAMILSFNKAVESSSNYINAYLIRASLYHNIELFDYAIADYTKVINLDPNNLQSYLERGSIYVLLGKFDEAISDCNRAVELNPYIETPYNNRGAAYYFKGEYDRAISDYMKALKIQPRLTRTYYALATAFDDKGDKDNAIKYYNFFIDYASKDQFASLIGKAQERLEMLQEEAP